MALHEGPRLPSARNYFGKSLSSTTIMCKSNLVLHVEPDKIKAKTLNLLVSCVEKF